MIERSANFNIFFARITFRINFGNSFTLTIIISIISFFVTNYLELNDRSLQIKIIILPILWHLNYEFDFIIFCGKSDSFSMK